MRRASQRILLAGVVVLAVLAVLAALTAGARAASRRFLFPAQEVRVAPAPDGFVERRVVARDGVVVRALELPARAGARTLVHFHTNRETVEGLAGFARAVHAAGVGVLLVEYRGYGRSAGTTTEAGVYADAEAMLDMLAARGVGPDDVVLSGASLGTGVAAEMARRGRGARLVLVAPYTSIPGLVEDVVPFAPGDLLVRDRFETLAKAPAIAIPTLVVHGDADEIVPFWMGERLARVIPRARLRRVTGGHHGDLFARDPGIVGAIVALAS